ncbi:MAG: PQQ-dependent sugar dehydrogenase [Planctomycetota bacterium]
MSRFTRLLAVILAGMLVAATDPAAGQNSADRAAAKTPAVWTQSRIQGAPQPPPAYRLRAVYPQVAFSKPTSVESLPGANRLLVTEIGGRIFTLPAPVASRAPASRAPATGTAAGKEPGASQKADQEPLKVTSSDLLVDLRTLLPAELSSKNLSLWDAEPHPNFSQNHYLFVCYVHPGDGGHTRVSRLQLTGDNPPQLVPGSEQVIITWPAGGHNAGCLEFGKDGYLYVATGDGAGPNPPDGLTTGQTVDDLLGAILRLDVDHPASAEQRYTVPADNPFVDLPGARPEIWFYGLRNPWKFGVDPQTGEMFVADNGWETWEMVHRVVKGGNGGWPIMEGRAALRTEVPVGPTPILPPAVDHPHTEANSVVGGTVYRGATLPALDGWFIYGDYITGTIWALQRNSEGGYSRTTLLDTDLQIVAFTQTESGQLLVLDFDVTGQIYELLPANKPDLSARFPRRLSETGLFQDVAKLKPAAGVLPYDITVARWMDGATAQRWIAVTPNFPHGTVLVKQLFIPKQASRKGARATDNTDTSDLLRLETQLLHYEDGEWHPYSYLWDEQGRDAELVDAQGASRVIKAADIHQPAGQSERTWHVNAVNECKLCHNANAGNILGFVPHQLHGRSATDERLKALVAHDFSAAAGIRSANSPAATTSSKKNRESTETAHTAAASAELRLVDPHDPQASLDDRARSYLHVNCSMCHHPRGNAIVSFYLRRDLPFEQLNTNKGTGIGTFGMSEAKIIKASDPYRSVLLYRMSKLGYARMPYIGSRLVDSAGVALIEEWIRSLPLPADAESPEQTRSAPLTKNSTAARALELLATADGGTPAERQAAVKELLSTTEGALALLTRLHAGRLAVSDAATTVELGRALSQSDIRGLVETFVPESQRRPTLGHRVDPRVVLERQGDKERGKLIFFSDGARCRACHDAADREQSLGPTLREINKKYPQIDELIQHVLQPSQKVDEAFSAYTVETADGRLLSGLLVKDNSTEVVLRTAEKRLVRIPREDVSELKRSAKSLMPDGLLSDLTAQEAADLLAYIKSLGVAP